MFPLKEKEELEVSNRRFPKMSAVIVTQDRYETVRKTICHLRTQTVKNQLEIVMVTPSIHELDLNSSYPWGCIRLWQHYWKR